MKHVNWKDVGVRCIKTFVEALLTYVAAALSGIRFGDGTFSDTAWVGVVITGGCTAVTAVINGVILPLFKNNAEDSPYSGPQLYDDEDYEEG